MKLKIKSMFLLGLGYFVGTRLGPQQIEQATRAALDSQPARPGLPLTRPSAAPVPSWPDADFPS